MISHLARVELNAVVADLDFIAENMMPADSSKDAVLRNVERIRMVLRERVAIAHTQRVLE